MQQPTIEDRLAALEAFASTAKATLATHGAMLNEKPEAEAETGLSAKIDAITARLHHHGIEVTTTD